MKSKSTATLLALFLGGFGFHKFYLDKPIQGLFYLIFCWTLIPSFLALIDFFILAFMDKDTFRYKYNY